jgi:hypothetical protein
MRRAFGHAAIPDFFDDARWLGNDDHAGAARGQR